ncbi:DNA methyltransferase [Candidatus Pelagibacter sp. HIMB1623]|uniref:DNA methyltransferase n=1 Tax=Candidatus Pelagibacter sp. HIMB1623 TaxID=3413358 RepID=UPI003F838275
MNKDKIFKEIKLSNKQIEKKHKLIDEWSIPRDRTQFYLTNDFHPYFAAYPPIIVKKIIDKYGNKKKPGTLLDPFMGGGSTIVEGYMNGYDCIGSDISEFSTFITSAKVTPVKINNDDCLNVLNKIKKNLLKKKLKIKLPNITNINKWFREDKIIELVIIKDVVNSIENKNKRNFFLLALSSILRSCSNAKNAQQHLNIQKDKKLPDTISLFEKKIFLMKNQMDKYFDYIKIKKIKNKVKLLSTDIRELKSKIKDNSIDLVITSPPYGTGSRYTDIYRLHFEFFDLEKPKFKSSLEKNKDFNEELKKGFENVYKILKKNSYFICVYGDPSTEESITDIAIKNCREIGFKFEGLISCPIEKKIFKHHTSYIRFIPKDFILVFKK